MSETRLQDTLGYWSNRLTLAMNVAFDRALEPFGITNPQWALLMVLYRCEAETPAELARILGVDGSAVTRLLDRVEAKGFVRRALNDSDRRSLRVELTDEGRELMPRTLEIAREFGERYAGSLTDDERDAFIRIARKVIESLGGA